MSDKSLSEIAWEVWNDVTALLEMHPTIIEELTAEREKYKLVPNRWPTPLLAALEIIQYRSMSAAGKGMGVTPTRVRRTLELVREYDCTYEFAKWIRNYPELFSKVVQRFGLRTWPYLINHIHYQADVRGESVEAILPLVLHPDVAERLNSRFVALRQEINEVNHQASIYKRQLALIGHLMSVTDPDAIERLVRFVWPVKEVKCLGSFTGDAMDVTIEELGFSVRTYNCLKKANKHVVRALTETNAEQFMNIRNFGRKSLIEVIEKLDHFGLTIDDWPGSIETVWALLNPTHV